MLLNEPFYWIGSGLSKRACLLLHGLGGGVYEMQLLGEYLHQQGMTVQGIAYPGHDRQAPKMPASTWPEWFDHVRASYEQLTQTHTQIQVIGFSTGCPLALHLAASYPVHKLVLLAPYLLLRRRWYYLLPLEALISSLGHWIIDVPRLWLPIAEPKMRQLAQEIVFFRSFNITAVRSAMELIDLVKQELHQITVPTLIMQSQQDSVVDPSGAEYLHQHLGAQEKWLHWLSRSDHVIGLDVERQEVFRTVGKFLCP